MFTNNIHVYNYTGEQVRLYKDAERASDNIHHRWVWVEGEEGRPYIEFPSRGRLGVTVDPQTVTNMVVGDGTDVPFTSPLKVRGVDPLPEAPEGTMYIVSAMYIAACRELGIPTDRLLTVGEPVIDDENWLTVLGYVSLVRN